LKIDVSEESVQDVKHVSQKGPISQRGPEEQPLVERIIGFLRAMKELRKREPESNTATSLSTATSAIGKMTPDDDPRRLIEAVWLLLSAADSVSILSGSDPWQPSLHEREVWAALDALRAAAIKVWLEIIADEHMGQRSGQFEHALDLDSQPPTVAKTQVKPVTWDDAGIGRVEFTSALGDGRTFTTTRVVPPPKKP
jgi:hypothetical protein